ncbi:hypothetical protein EJC51_06990 [Streptomyces aquilus]|uniref:Uncharacterized protein n=1 Tax=Streptomyces aquilus TaxID=2548456 RepID=A0A3Q9BW21_9ACTN|nr:hypothetical protein [Streptomyces aquilus]AZP15871.1 hypothetical protein EJC51_06990 [Streptomyces aquilus]
MTERLVRTDYTDPTVSPPEPRQGDTGLRESRQDQEGFYVPLHRLHGSALHDKGVAVGLAVDTTVGQQGVRVGPGVALDGRGRLLPLAVGGHAKLEDGSLVTVAQLGVVLSTQGLSGSRYFTIAWAETFDFTGIAAGAFNTETTPLLRLRKPEEFVDDDTEIILAEVVIDAGGKVTGLDVVNRRAVGSSPNRVRLSRTAVERVGALAIASEVSAGELRALRNGGLVLKAQSLSVQPPDGDASALWVAPSSGRVGVGTTQPEAPLDVQGTAVFRDRVGIGTAVPETQLDVTGGAVVRGPASVHGTSTVLGTTVLRGRVGIRTTTPDVDLDVAGDAVVRDRLCVGRTQALARVHAIDQGGFTDEDSTGASTVTHVPLLAQSDSTAIGILNAQKRPAFAINIDANGGTPDQRGVPTLYDKYDGWWRPGISLKNGRVGMGTQDPECKLQVTTDEANLSALAAYSAHTFALHAISGDGTGLFAFGKPAGQFWGDLVVSGKITKSAVQFMIDHPLDPAGRYLSHCAVESDEMKNVYDGEVVLDETGGAEITLPDWFEALNERFRYQLTAVGRPAPDLHVSRKLSDNRFSIAGGEPGTEVCWQVTGVRHDAYALANPLVVESDKEGEEYGRYRHPEEHGVSADLNVNHGLMPAAGRPG